MSGRRRGCLGGGRESWEPGEVTSCLVERPRRTFSDCRPVPCSLHPCAPAGDEHTHEHSHLHSSRYRPEAQKARTFRIAKFQAREDSGQKARNSFRDISKMQNHLCPDTIPETSKLTHTQQAVLTLLKLSSVHLWTFLTVLKLL